MNGHHYYYIYSILVPSAYTHNNYIRTYQPTYIQYIYIYYTFF